MGEGKKRKEKKRKEKKRKEKKKKERERKRKREEEEDGIHLKILGARRVTWGMCHNGDTKFGRHTTKLSRP